MKNILKIVGIFILFFCSAFISVNVNADSVPEIKEGEEWRGTFESGKQYLSFTPTETGYYDLEFAHYDEKEGISWETWDFQCYDPADDTENGTSYYFSLYSSGSDSASKEYGMYLVGGKKYTVYLTNSYYDMQNEKTIFSSADMSVKIMKNKDGVKPISAEKNNYYINTCQSVVYQYTTAEKGNYMFELQVPSPDYRVSMNVFKVEEDGNLTSHQCNYRYGYSFTDEDYYDEFDGDVQCLLPLEGNSTYYIEISLWDYATEESYATPVILSMKPSEIEVTGIEIIKEPNKIVYSTDDFYHFDSTGMVLKLTFADGTTEDINYSWYNYMLYNIKIYDLYGEDEDEYEDVHNEPGTYTKIVDINGCKDTFEYTIKSMVDCSVEIGIEEKKKAEPGTYLWKFTPNVSGYYAIYPSPYENYRQNAKNFSCGIFDKNDQRVQYMDDGYKLVADETYCLKVYLSSSYNSVYPFEYMVKLNDLHKHTFGEWNMTQATCTEAGHASRVCQDCGFMQEATSSPLGHRFGDWTISQSATDTAEGIQIRKCSVCGFTESMSIPKTPTAVLQDTPKMNITLSRGTIKKVTSKKKAALIKIKKDKNATGYVVSYSLKKNFKNEKQIKTSKTNVTLKKLKSKKKYYIRIRAYHTQNGNTIYGSYSKTKVVKVK